MPENNPPLELGKIRWKCRRGMLELDMILLRFFDKHYLQLSCAEQQDFSDLLNESDPMLYNWLLGYSKPEDKRLEGVLELIRSSSESIG